MGNQIGRALPWAGHNVYGKNAFYREWTLPPADDEGRGGDSVTLSGAAVRDLESVRLSCNLPSVVHPGNYCDYVF